MPERTKQGAGDESTRRRSDIVARFRARFGTTPEVCWSPGRVNLIGDHIDYCGGPVLPMPIQFGTMVAAQLNGIARVRGSSVNVAGLLDAARSDLCVPPVGSWGRFLYGAIAVLADLGIDIEGVDVVVDGDIPGSGLSSSASLSVGLLYALISAVGRELAPLQLALSAQRIEHEYVGVQCGLMDQAVIALAQPGCALLFDCVDHAHRSIALDDPTVRLIVADTGRARQLVHSEYNARLLKTRVAADALGVGATALARLDPDEFRSRELEIDDAVARRRARHVVNEAARVGEAAAALGSHDWVTLGALFSASHDSLRRDFEVSCTELDALTTSLEAQPGCYGARMTGAGFGGSVVALFDADAVETSMMRATGNYADRFGHTAPWFAARSLGGVRLLHG